MDDLKNYIYYSICEKSYELFEKTNYMTYTAFCNGLKNAILLDELDYDDSHKLMDIFSYVKKIYGLEHNESGDYVRSYFIDEKFREFENPIRLMNEYFKNSLN
jgi:hypothetical protein